jgi:TRAP-type C4-dicarboxylate transport system substrate-binding protein
LPTDVKALIDKTTGPAAAEAYGKMWDEAEKHGKESLVSKGVQVVAMAPAEIDRVKKLVAPQIDAALADAEKKGGAAKKFFDDYTK